MNGIEVDELLYDGIIKENAEYMIRFYNEDDKPVNIELYKELKNVGTTQYYAYSIKPNTTVNLVTWDQNPYAENTLFMLEKSRDPDIYGSYYNVRSVAHPQYYLAMGRYNLTYSGGPYEFQIAKDKSYNSYYPSFYVKEKYTNFSYVYHLGLVDNSFEFKTNRPSEGSAEYRQYQAKLAKIFENVAVRKETVCCYDGNVHLPETPIGVNDGTVEYSMTGTDGTWTSAPTSAGGFPVNAGEYTVYMKIMSSTTDPSPCKDLIVSAKVRIVDNPVVSDSPEAVNPTFTVDDSGNPIAYELVTAGAADGGVMKYSLDNRTWSTSIPTATAAGEYTVYYKAVGTGAQAGSESTVASVTATMQKREVEVPSVATYSCEYNGQLQTLPDENIRDFDSKYVEVLRGHTGTDSCKYSVYFGLKYKDSTVWHGSTDSEDRYRSQVWEITKRAVTVTGLSAVDRDYEYDNRTVEITGTPVLNDVLECDEGQVDIDTTSIPTTGTILSASAGNGRVVTCANNIKLTGEKAGNYTLTQPTLTVNILKASATINNPPTAIGELVYDGSEHELVTAASSGDATGGIINYSMDQENWSTTVPKGTDAGEYTVYYKAIANISNYKDSEVKSVKVTIAQAEVNEPTVSGSYT
ncbi:MAG: YDG domain-containing protein, partial [Clostridia bacterium]